MQYSARGILSHFPMTWLHNLLVHLFSIRKSFTLLLCHQGQGKEAFQLSEQWSESFLSISSKWGGGGHWGLTTYCNCSLLLEETGASTVAGVIKNEVLIDQASFILRA